MSERDTLRALALAVQNYVRNHPLAQCKEGEDVEVCLRHYEDWCAYSADVARKQVKSRACQWCGVAMFFAREPYGEYWVPFDVERIPAKSVKAQYRHVIDFDGLVPVVHWDATYTKDVWVDHRMVCGRWPEPRPGATSGVLLQKWKANRAMAQKMESDEWATLEKTLRSIAEK